MTLPYRRKRKMIEHGIQVAVVDWRNWNIKRIPELKLLHAIPNGAAVRGHKKVLANGDVIRLSNQGKRLRREGLTKGMLDMSWPVPRGHYHGLYIEHKRPDGDPPSKEQREVMVALRALGYYVTLSTSSEFTIAQLSAYWELGPYDNYHATELMFL